MSRSIDRLTVFALILMVLAGAVGVRLGLASSNDLRRIAIKSVPTVATASPEEGQRDLMIVYRTGRIVFLLGDGYREATVPAASSEDLFRFIEEQASTWDDRYGPPDPSSVVALELVGLERRIEIADLYMSSEVPAGLRSVIAVIGRWTREVDISARPVPDLPLRAYALPMPSGLDMPEYATPAALDLSAATDPAGVALDATTIEAIRSELPAFGKFAGDNSIHIVDTAGVNLLLTWNVDWDRVES